MAQEERAQVRAWFAAASEPAVQDLLGAIHGELARATDAAKPLCTASGRCCHFEQWGHRLYLTGLETAATLVALPAARRPDESDVALSLERGDCPFLVDERCSIHPQRPLGCRLYFCDPTWASTQDDLAERLHRRVVQLHETWSIPYRYGEWRAMLALFARCHDDAHPA